MIVNRTLSLVRYDFPFWVGTSTWVSSSTSNMSIRPSLAIRGRTAPEIWVSLMKL